MQRIGAQPIKGRAAVALSADPVIEVDLGEIPSALRGDALQVDPLVVGGLIGLADPQVNADALLLGDHGEPPHG